jgi:DNA-binding NarL/FixJ family response regulator
MQSQTLVQSEVVAADVDAVWEALVGDSGADIAILDADGKFHYVSPVLSWWALGPSRGDIMGKTLHEVMPKDIADERLSILQRVAATGRAIVLHAQWRGIRTRTTMRLLPGSPKGAGARVLLVCRGAVPADQTKAAMADTEVVHAKHIDKGPLATLTPRELEILGMIGRGMTTAAIAKKLFRSRKTIEAHRLSLGAKLGVRNRVELARIALQSGLVTDDPDGDMPAGLGAGIQPAPSRLPNR